MSKYRKKPVVIDAEQIPPRIEEDRLRYYEHLGVERIPFPARIWIGPFGVRTPEGWSRVVPGDYVVRGVKGELYPCKPDIFEATHEPVDAP